MYKANLNLKFNLYAGIAMQSLVMNPFSHDLIVMSLVVYLQAPGF